MKQTIRLNTFETNSSTTHSMVVIPDEQWEAWESKQLYFLRDDWGWRKDLLSENNNHEFFTKDFLLTSKTILNQEDFPARQEDEDDEDYEERLEEFFRDNDIVNSDNWAWEELEEDCHEYTTKSGDKVHILCRYGYDG